MSANREMLRSDDYALNEPHASYRPSSNQSMNARIFEFKRFTDSLRHSGPPTVSSKSTFIETSSVEIPRNYQLADVPEGIRKDLIDLLVRFAQREPAYSGTITELLFRYLLDSGSDRNRIFELLIHINNPIALWHAAIQEYDKAGGYEIPSMASSLLGYMANRNPSFLERIVREDDSASEFLPYMIASRKSLDIEARKALLTKMTQSKFEDVREVALEALESISS